MCVAVSSAVNTSGGIASQRQEEYDQDNFEGHDASVEEVQIHSHHAPGNCPDWNPPSFVTYARHWRKSLECREQGVASSA